MLHTLLQVAPKFKFLSSSQKLLWAFLLSPLMLAQRSLAQDPFRLPPKSPEIPGLKIPKPDPLQIDIPPIESPQQNEIPPITVQKFVFIGNTVISTKELENIVSDQLNKKLSFEEIVKLRDLLTKYYVDRGYINSGAIIPTKQNQNISINAATFTFQIIEGGLESINVNGSNRLQPYIVKRVKSFRKVLDINELRQKLRQLELDPLVKNISAKLEPGTDPNTANLNIDVQSQNPYKVEVFTNNHGNPVSGTFARGISFAALNPLKLGDRIDITYSNTAGSNALQASYTVPVNRNNTELKFTYSYGATSTIEEPFKAIDIRGSSLSYALELRHPIFRRITDNSNSELAITFGFKHIETQDSILGFSFPISRGADLFGQTRTTVLSFQQDWRYQDPVQATILKSKFNLGVDIGSATDPLFDQGQFVSWQGEAVYAHRLPWHLLFVSKMQVQFADRPVVGSEEFTLGGVGSVLGYQQDAALGDNGFFGSLEVQIPVYRGQLGTLSVTPTFGAGHTWNNPRTDGPSQTLASVGFGLQYNSPSDTFNASLGFGLPLIDVKGNNQTLQDAGVSLGFRWRLF